MGEVEECGGVERRYDGGKSIYGVGIEMVYRCV
jgi:hypothetical protein